MSLEHPKDDPYEEMFERVIDAAKSAASDLHWAIQSKGIHQGKTLAAEYARRKGFNEAADAIIEDRDMPF